MIIADHRHLCSLVLLQVQPLFGDTCRVLADFMVQALRECADWATTDILPAVAVLMEEHWEPFLQVIVVAVVVVMVVMLVVVVVVVVISCLSKIKTKDNACKLKQQQEERERKKMMGQAR